jgi:Flp pilus assembly protein TadG
MLKRLIGRFGGDERGSATVEVAILTPLLFILVIGAADFARIYSARMSVVGAAEAGAQYGARSKVTSGDFSGIEQAAREAAKGRSVEAHAKRLCQCNGAAVTCTSTCNAGSAPEVYVEVKATTSFKTALVYPGMPHNVPLGHTATVRVQ